MRSMTYQDVRTVRQAFKYMKAVTVKDPGRYLNSGIKRDAWQANQKPKPKRKKSRMIMVSSPAADRESENRAARRNAARANKRILGSRLGPTPPLAGKDLVSRARRNGKREITRRAKQLARASFMQMVGH